MHLLNRNVGQGPKEHVFAGHLNFLINLMTSLSETN